MAFASVKNKKHRQALSDLLVFIADATMSESGGALVPLAEAEKINKAHEGLIEINVASKNAAGQVQARATQAGLDEAKTVKETPVKESKPRAQMPKDMQFKIESDVEVPPILRGGAKPSIYPFDQLEVGQSFFIPASEQFPNPAKSLASAVGSATKKEKGKGTGKDGQDKKYVLRSRTQEQHGEVGARIWRSV